MADLPRGPGQTTGRSLSRKGVSEDSKQSQGLPAYHYSPLQEDQNGTESAANRPAPAESHTHANPDPASSPPVESSATQENEDAAHAAAALLSLGAHKTSKGADRIGGKEDPATASALDMRSTTWSGVFRTPKNKDNTLVGISATPGAIATAVAKFGPPPSDSQAQDQDSLDNARISSHSPSALLAGRPLVDLSNPDVAEGIAPSAHLLGMRGGQLLNALVNAQSGHNTQQNSTTFTSTSSTTVKTSSRPQMDAGKERATPARSRTPEPPVTSPLTPPSAPYIDITSAELPRTEGLDSDSDGALARRVDIYQTFQTAGDFVKQTVHPIDHDIVHPPIHSKYIIKTVSTIKCDECNSKLVKGGELYQCKTCSAQICQTCVDEKFEQEIEASDMRRKAKKNPKTTASMHEDTMQYRFTWGNRTKHMPFRKVYLDRRERGRLDHGSWEGTFTVADPAGIRKEVYVRLIADSSRARSGRKSKNAGDESDEDSVVGARKQPVTSEAKAQALRQASANTTNGAFQAINKDKDECSDGLHRAVFGNSAAGGKLKKIEALAKLPTSKSSQLRSSEAADHPPSHSRPVASVLGLHHNHSGDARINESVQLSLDQRVPRHAEYGRRDPQIQYPAQAKLSHATTAYQPYPAHPSTIGEELRGTPTAAFPGRPVNYTYRNSFNTRNGNPLLPFVGPATATDSGVGNQTRHGLRPYVPLPSILLPASVHCGFYLDESNSLSAADSRVFAEQPPSNTGVPLSSDLNRTWHQGIMFNPSAHEFLLRYFAGQPTDFYLPNFHMQPRQWLQARMDQQGICLAQVRSQAREEAQTMLNQILRPYGAQTPAPMVAYDTNVVPLRAPTGSTQPSVFHSRRIDLTSPRSLSLHRRLMRLDQRPPHPQNPSHARPLRSPVFGSIAPSLETIITHRNSAPQHQHPSQVRRADRHRQSHKAAAAVLTSSEMARPVSAQSQPDPIVINSDSEPEVQEKIPLNVVRRAPSRHSSLQAQRKRSNSSEDARAEVQEPSVRLSRGPSAQVHPRKRLRVDSAFLLQGSFFNRPMLVSPPAPPLDPAPLLLPGRQYQAPNKQAVAATRQLAGTSALLEVALAAVSLPAHGLPLRYAMLPGLTYVDTAPPALPLTAPVHTGQSAAVPTQGIGASSAASGQAEDAIAVSSDGDTEVLSEMRSDAGDASREATVEDGKGEDGAMEIDGEVEGNLTVAVGGVIGRARSNESAATDEQTEAPEIDEEVVSGEGEFVMEDDGVGEASSADGDTSGASKSESDSGADNNESQADDDFTASPTPTVASRGLGLVPPKTAPQAGSGRLRSGKEFQ